MPQSRREWREEVEESSQATENAILTFSRAREDLGSAEEEAKTAQHLVDRAEAEVRRAEESVSHAEQSLHAAREALRATEGNPKASNQEKEQAHRNVDSASEAKARAERDLSEAKRNLASAQNKLKEAKTRLRNAEDQAEQAAQLADRAHSGMHGLVEAAKEQLRNSEGFGFRPIKTLHDDRFGEMEMRLEEEVGFLRSTICDLEDCLQRLDEATSRCNRSTTGWRSSTLADRVGGTHINFLPPLPGYLGFPLSPSSSPPLVRPLLPPTPQWPIREGNCLSTWTAFPSSYQSSHYLNPLGNSGALSLNFMGSSVRPVELNPPKLDLLVKYGVRPEEVLGEGDCKNYYYKKVNSWWQGGGCELEDFGVRPEMVLGEGSCKNYMYEKANSWWRSPAPSLSFGGSTFGSNSIFQPPPLRFG